MSDQKIWSGILAGVKSQVSSSAYKAWFSGSYLMEIKKEQEKEIFVVACKNNFLKRQLETKYMPLVLEEAKTQGFSNCQVVYVVSQMEKESTPKTEPLFSGVLKTYVNYSRKADSLNPNHTFDNFVVGPSNNLAHMAFSQAASNLGSLYNPVFVYGPTGVGKTHLLQALGNYVLSNVLDVKVLYASAEKFTNDYIESLNNRTQQTFRQKYRSVDVLIVDDVQFFAGKESTQDEFFHTFEELALSGRQLVIASDKHPKDLIRIKDRLTSRFMGGMTVDIAKADVELRAAILKAKCKEKNVFLSDEVINYIAKVCDRGAREIEGVLVQVLSLVRLSGGKVGLEEIREVVERNFKKDARAISAGSVIEAVCRHSKISRQDLCGPSRKASFAYPRQILMFLLRVDLGLSFFSVGELLGGRDHSTVLYGVEKIQGLLNTNKGIGDELSRIRSKF